VKESVWRPITEHSRISNDTGKSDWVVAYLPTSYDTLKYSVFGELLSGVPSTYREAVVPLPILMKGLTSMTSKPRDEASRSSLAALLKMEFGKDSARWNNHPDYLQIFTDVCAVSFMGGLAYENYVNKSISARKQSYLDNLIVQTSIFETTYCTTFSQKMRALGINGIGVWALATFWPHKSWVYNLVKKFMDTRLSYWLVWWHPIYGDIRQWWKRVFYIVLARQLFSLFVDYRRLVAKRVEKLNAPKETKILVQDGSHEAALAKIIVNVVPTPGNNITTDTKPASVAKAPLQEDEEKMENPVKVKDPPSNTMHMSDRTKPVGCTYRMLTEEPSIAEMIFNDKHSYDGFMPDFCEDHPTVEKIQEDGNEYTNHEFKVADQPLNVDIPDWKLETSWTTLIEGQYSQYNLTKRFVSEFVIDNLGTETGMELTDDFYSYRPEMPRTRTKSDPELAVITNKQIALPCMTSAVVNPKQPAKNCSLSFLPGTKTELDQSFHLIGPSFIGCIPGVFASTEHNATTALLSRHLKTAPFGPEHERLWREARRKVLPEIYNLTQPYYQVCTREQWLEGTDPKKREDYQKFLARGDDLDFKNPKLHTRQFFTKTEVQIPPPGGKLVNKAPRGIQGLKIPATNIALGPFITGVSKAFSAVFTAVDINASKRDWARYNYTSGSTAERVGQWKYDMEKQGYSFLEDDFSAYDSTQGTGAHQTEMEFYKKFSPPKCALNALEQQAQTKGFSKYHKYSVKSTRKSGDQNTGLGNTEVNFVAHGGAIHAFEDLHKIKIPFSMLGLGDDNLIAYKLPASVSDEEFVKFIDTYIRNLGLEPKLSKPAFPTYCSCEFLPIRRMIGGKLKKSYVLCPKLDRYLTKMGYTTSYVGKTSKLTQGRLRGNALGQTILQLLPVGRVINSYYANLSEDKVVSSVSGEWKSHHAVESITHLQPRDVEAWFEQVYGLSKEEVVETERFMSTVIAKNNGDSCFYYHQNVAKLFLHRRS